MMGLRVFLGSPCYDSMELEFVGSLIASMDMLRERGHELCDWGYVKGTLPHFARNSQSSVTPTGAATPASPMTFCCQ